ILGVDAHAADVPSLPPGRAEVGGGDHLSGTQRPNPAGSDRSAVPEDLNPEIVRRSVTGVGHDGRHLNTVASISPVDAHDPPLLRTQRSRFRAYPPRATASW